MCTSSATGTRKGTNRENMIDYESIRQIFPEAKRKGQSVFIRCPFHSGGQERTPSLSILTQSKGGLQEGLCKCFSCGWAGTYKSLLTAVGVRTDDIVQHIDAPTALTPSKSTHITGMPWKYSQYMEMERGITAPTQERFKVFEKGTQIHMPVFTKDGFYAYSIARDLRHKQYYVDEYIRKEYLYALNEIDPLKTVFVVEGQIDALTLWETGFQAVALLSTTAVELVSILKDYPSPIVLAFDNDTAGQRATEQAKAILAGKVLYTLEIRDAKDINELWVQAYKELSYQKASNAFCRYIMEAIKRTK